MIDLIYDIPAGGDPGCPEKLLTGKQFASYN